MRNKSFLGLKWFSFHVNTSVDLSFIRSVLFLVKVCNGNLFDLLLFLRIIWHILSFHYIKYSTCTYMFRYNSTWYDIILSLLILFKQTFQPILSLGVSEWPPSLINIFTKIWTYKFIHSLAYLFLHTNLHGHEISSRKRIQHFRIILHK